MNKRIRKKKQKQQERVWAKALERMRRPDFWKRAKPTGWAYAGDNATWAPLALDGAMSLFGPERGEEHETL